MGEGAKFASFVDCRLNEIGVGTVDYHENYEECLAEAAKAASSTAKEQWMVFAKEWLKLAQEAEDQQRRETATSVVPAK